MNYPSVLLIQVTSKHRDDFYCLNWIHSFRTKNKLESQKKVCEKKDFCNIVMPSEDTKVLEFNQYRKSEYKDCDCFLEYKNFKENLIE